MMDAVKAERLMIRQMPKQIYTHYENEGLLDQVQAVAVTRQGEYDIELDDRADIWHWNRYGTYTNPVTKKKYPSCRWELKSSEPLNVEDEELVAA